MNLFELVTYLREDLLDDGGGQGVDWTNYRETNFDSIQLRWTNENLVSNINEAIKQVYRRTNPIKALITLSITSGTNTYSIPSYVTSIEAVKRSTGEEVEVRKVEELWHLNDLDTRVGYPLYYMPDITINTIKLYPTPNYSGTLNLLVNRLPLTDLSWDDNEAIPELKSEYHIPMLFGAASLCYLKDESNTFDINRSTMYSALFDREFPFTSAYSNISKSRGTRRVMKYGGL